MTWLRRHIHRNAPANNRRLTDGRATLSDRLESVNVPGLAVRGYARALVEEFYHRLSPAHRMITGMGRYTPHQTIRRRRVEEHRSGQSRYEQ